MEGLTTSEIVKIIAQETLTKKELSTLDTESVQREVNRMLESNSKLRGQLQSSSRKELLKKRQYDLMLKRLRKELREVYGLFIRKGYHSKKADEPIADLIKTHQSTYERADSYVPLYKKMAELILGFPKEGSVHIYDLGCGLNPVTAPLLEKELGKKIVYSCTDISEQDMMFLNDYFRNNNIRGEAFAADMTSDFAEIRTDKKELNVFLLFKLLDTLETIKRHSSKKLMAHIFTEADIILVSFPKTGISGRKNIHKDRRSWFDSFLKKENVGADVFEIGQEIFYCIRNVYGTKH